MTIDQIEAVALELPQDDREELIARLSASRARSADVRQAWLNAAERRMELIRGGKMRLMDADEALTDPDFAPGG